MSLRISEWIWIVYWGCVILQLFFIFRLARRLRIFILFLNCALLAALFLIPYGERLTSPLFISVVRDWFPAPLILVAYYEAGLLISTRRDHAWEQRFLAWDQVLLENSWFSTLRSPSLRWLEQYGEFSYLLCYPLVPFGMASLYLARQGHLADRFWISVLPAILVCYGLSPFFPSLPPRTCAPGLSPPEKTLFIRRVNLWILKHASIQANTFPSAHVAAAVATALTLLRYLPPVGAIYLLIAIGITLGTVYGRYHYAADSIVGILVGVMGYTIASWFYP